MIEQVGNEDNGMPLEAVLPLLVQDYSVYEMFCEEFGTDRMAEVYHVIEGWDLTGELGKSVRSIVDRWITEEAETRWCGTMAVNGRRISFEIRCFAGIYVICTEEPREFGYFLSLEDARAFLKFHWSPVAQAIGSDDDFVPEEWLEEQAAAHAYIDRVRRQRKTIG